MKKIFLAILIAALPLLASAQSSIHTAWAVYHAPAAGVTPTITKAAPASGQRHVITHVTICVAGATTVQPAMSFNLWDGATAVWAARISTPANSTKCVSAPVFIVATINSSVRVSASGAPVADAFATVSMDGYTTY